MSSKQAVRGELERRRRALSAAEVSTKGGQAQARLAALPFLASPRVVALYAAQSFELPTDALAAALLNRGVTLCLPRVVPSDRVLRFHQVGEPLVRGPLALMQPPASAPTVALHEIDVWVVPGVGFTPQGDRLGRGGGYYDVTLPGARVDAWKVGVCFDCCLVEQLPTEAHDLKVDAVVTESMLYWVRSP